MKDFCNQKEARIRKLYWLKMGWLLSGLISFEVRQGCHTDDLPSADQGISDEMVEYSISGRAKTVIKLSFGLVKWA